MRDRASWILFAGSIVLLAGCGSGSAGVPDTGPPPVDQCSSPTDMAITQADAGASDGGVFTDTGGAVGDCGRGPCLDIALSGGDITECVRTCLAGTVYEGLSDGCLGCYIDSFDCAREDCVVPCLGSDVAACHVCIEDYCIPDFIVCSGFVPS